jgi:hypothetical protein
MTARGLLFSHISLSITVYFIPFKGHTSVLGKEGSIAKPPPVVTGNGDVRGEDEEVEKYENAPYDAAVDTK